MMTGPSRPRRRRGRRGGQRAQQEQPQQPLEGAPPSAEENREGQAADAGESRPQRDARSRPAGEQQGGREGGGRKRNRNRRRSARRPTIGPVPTEVLKDSARAIPARETIATRTLDEFQVPGGMTFGCPMLSRTRLGMPFAGGNRVARCSMGWALHGESEAMLCMRTPDLLDCWKEHPEKEAELRATETAENAAD